MSPGKGKKKKRKKKGRGGEAPSQAERADRFDLYQRAVQGPEADLEFYEGIFRGLRGRVPLTLREDFCGTAFTATTWVRGGSRRRAVGVDLDGATLDWGRRHNLEKLRPSVRRRIQLFEADVRAGVGPVCDITAAMNFSFCTFKTRAELGGYFRVVHDHLAPDGVFFTELYGGTEAIIATAEERDADGFRVTWEQERYNPIDHTTLCHLHFAFDDGSVLERAFTYDWRLWSVPEVRELLAEAGFRETRVYWEAMDEDGEGTGEYLQTEQEENQETWLVYLVAVK